MRRWCAELVLCAAVTSPAWTADFLRQEVFGVVGVGKSYDDEGSLGSGFNGGGGFGYRLSRRWAVEAEVNVFRTRREFSSQVPAFQANGAHAMLSGLLYLTQGRGQAYVIFGGGLLHTNVVRGFGGGAGRSASGGAVNLGGGVKASISPRVFVRPEVRLLSGGSGPAIEAPFSVIRVSLGLGYQW
jgi:hypothetical protein